MTSLDLHDVHELNTVRSAFTRMRAYLIQQKERDRRAGWQPEPGKKNVHDLRMATLLRLMGRLGMTTTGG